METTKLMDRDLALELARVTEAAAIGSAKKQLTRQRYQA